MKLIIAYIQPHKLTEVQEEIYKSEIFKISVTNALGCGQQKGYREQYRGVQIAVDLLKKTRIEIAVNADFVQPTNDGIVRGARTGEVGDGKIFVQPLDDRVRSRSGETGSDANG